jgi:hypothetical protein
LNPDFCKWQKSKGLKMKRKFNYELLKKSFAISYFFQRSKIIWQRWRTAKNVHLNRIIAADATRG